MGTKSKIAVYSMVLGLACFLNLFGIEKALAAIIAGWLGLKEVKQEEKAGRGFAIAGIALGTAYIITIAVLLILKGPEFVEMISKISGK